MIFKVPVEFVVHAQDEFHQNKQLQEFLSRCFRDFAASYNVVDYIIKSEHTKMK